MASLEKSCAKSRVKYVQKIMAVDMAHPQRTILRAVYNNHKGTPSGIVETTEIKQPLGVSLSYTCSSYYLLNT